MIKIKSIFQDKFHKEDEVQLGKKSGVDVSVYEGCRYGRDVMEAARLALEHGVNPGIL